MLSQNAADSFNPDVNGVVRAIAFKSDGSCLIGGDFTTVGGESRSRLARVLPDGSVDPGFNPGANGRVNALAVLADGRILAGGQLIIEYYIASRLPVEVTPQIATPGRRIAPAVSVP